MIEAGLHRWAAPFLDRYNRRILSRAFARVRVSGLRHLKPTRPVVAAPNHTCWWDGCVDLFLSRTVASTESFLMMGEKELSRHKVFSSLGVFGVADEGSRERARSTRYALSLLESSGPRVIWIYPQGEMRPARARVEAREGIAMLARRSNARVLPVGHRYEFIRDDHPDVLVRIGEPIDLVSERHGASRQLAEAIGRELDQIDDDLLQQSFDDYETVLTGPTTRSDRLRRT